MHTSLSLKSVLLNKLHTEESCFLKSYSSSYFQNQTKGQSAKLTTSPSPPFSDSVSIMELKISHSGFITWSFGYFSTLFQTERPNYYTAYNKASLRSRESREKLDSDTRGLLFSCCIEISQKFHF